MKSANLVLVLCLLANQAKAQRPRQLRCPADYVLKGGNCERRNYLPGIQTCMKGYLKGESCVVTEDVKYVCPEGSILENGKCIVDGEKDPKLVCPENAYDLGGACYSYSVRDIVEECETGQLVNGQCEYFDEVAPIKSTTCPVGYVPTEGSCWKSFSLDCTPPKYSAPEISNAVCTDEGEDCTDKVSAVAIIEKQCVVRVQSEPINTFICPEGAIQKGETCLQKTVLPSKLRCEYSQNHMCFPTQLVNHLAICDVGYVLKNDKCVPDAPISMIPTCAEGLIMHEELGCIRKVGVPVTQCPENSILIGSTCVQIEIINAIEIE